MWIFQLEDKEGNKLIFATLEENHGGAQEEAIISLLDSGYSEEDAKFMVEGANEQFCYSTLFKPL